MIKISFDIGGVLSKYPDIFREIVYSLQCNTAIKVYILSDMHDVDLMHKMLTDNGFVIPKEDIHSCDWNTHGELCKSVKMKELGIDLHIDDYPGYISEGCPVRLLLMPDAREPYWHDNWIAEGDFGRRKKNV